MISIIAQLSTLDGSTQQLEFESYLEDPPESIRMPMEYRTGSGPEYRLYRLEHCDFLGKEDDISFYMTAYLEELQ
jgi:hypothetical protein